MLSPVPHLGKAAIDWSVEGPRYRDRILDYLEKRYIPNLGRTWRRPHLHAGRLPGRSELARRLGLLAGADPDPERLVPRAQPRLTHRRLYFVGAGTHPGAGVPGVVGSAKATAGLMIDDCLGESG